MDGKQNEKYKSDKDDQSDIVPFLEEDEKENDWYDPHDQVIAPIFYLKESFFPCFVVFVLQYGTKRLPQQEQEEKEEYRHDHHPEITFLVEKGKPNQGSE
jgi:hypothetical protein